MKQKFIRGVFLWLLVFGLVLGGNGTSLFAEGGTLDGKNFIGEVGEKGQQSGMKDEFIFKEGRFRSTACDPYGFGDAAYTTTAEGETAMFEAETNSPTDGTMKWRGIVKGDRVEGTSMWYRPGKDVVEHWFKGELKTNTAATQ